MENDGVKYSEEIEKVINEEKRSCALYGTEACRVLNAENCSECAVGSMSADKQEKTKRALERLIEAAHPEELESLYSGDACRFCRKEAEKAGGVALIDLTKRDPEGDWTIGLGKKRIGFKGADMILPLQISCCKKCRRAYRLYDYLPTAVGLAVVAAGLIIATNSYVYKAAYTAAQWLPAAIVLGSVAAAIIIGLALKAALGASLKKRMHTDVAELPEIKTLMDNGFAELTPKKRGVSVLVFSKTRREHGVCSRVSEKEPEFPDGGEPQVMGIWPAEAYQCGENEQPETEKPETENE